jgi:hypothetical protein
LLVPSLAHADRKSFTNTYEYATLPEGQTEVELWHTQSRDTWESSTPQRFEEKLEVEHGITDHWDMAMYLVFGQVAGDATTEEPFGFDSLRFESRYRLADRGQWPIDTVLYGEVGKDFGAGVYELEGKVILARDFDRLTVAGNAIVEIAVGHDVAETNVEVGWAAGASYEITPKVKFGAETWGERAREDQIVRGYVGPALSLAPSNKLWVTAGLGFGVNSDADAFSGRIIVGLGL